MASSALLAFSMDPVDDLSDRFGLTVTLLLTAVAFQFVVSSELPQLPYLTLLDEYIIMSFIFLFIVMVMVGLIPLTGNRYDYDSEDEESHRNHIITKVDYYTFLVSLGILVVYHIFHMIRIILVRREEVPKIDLDAWDYEELEEVGKKLKEDENALIDPKLNRINLTLSESVRVSPSLTNGYIDPDLYKDCKLRQ